MRNTIALAILACAATMAAQAQESGAEVEERNYNDGDHSFLTRVGGSYEIEFSGWSLSPEVNVDFVDDDTVLVFGASFVWKF